MSIYKVEIEKRAKMINGIKKRGRTKCMSRLKRGVHGWTNLTFPRPFFAPISQHSGIYCFNLPWPVFNYGRLISPDSILTVHETSY